MCWGQHNITKWLQKASIHTGVAEAKFNPREGERERERGGVLHCDFVFPVAGREASSPPTRCGQRGHAPLALSRMW